jgi:NhaP-type Na+/H+ or K+/H+ antiporter
MTETILEIHRVNPGLAILLTLVIVFVIGTIAQVLADRLRIPAVAPLLLAGLIAGPFVLGIVQPSILGPGLRAVIRAAVAVCIFEGGMLLDLGALRQSSRAVAGLISFGLLITTVLAGITAHFFLGWPWEVSILFGAIISVTGPTVITPILQRVRVNERVRATLESESVIADPLGVILAALILTAITSPGGVRHALVNGANSLAAGIGIGLAVAAVMWLVVRMLRLLPSKFTRLATLGAALVAYTTAELFFHEAGVLAAAVAGIAIGSMRIPEMEQVAEFKGDLASMAISAVFILLAAGIRPADMAALGWEGAAVVAMIMLVIRPTRVFLSTIGSELRPNEKLFISFLGPRGIVAASIGAIFGLRLTDAGYAQGGPLETLVFAVVITTVLIEGNAAAWLARWCKVMPRHTIIVGADETARLLAAEIAAAGESVALIDSDPDSCASARDLRGVRVFCADATDASVLRRAGAEHAQVLVTATSSDKVNLLVCQNARAAFSIKRIVARTNDSSNLSAFESAGIETMSPARAAAAVLSNLVLRPSLFRLLAAPDPTTQVAEVRISSSSGRTLRQLALTDVIVVALRRGMELLVPSGSTELRAGDVLTLLGHDTAIAQARERLERLSS